MLFFDAWSWHLGHLDSCQSLLERKKSSSLPLQTHGCLTSFKCHLHVDVIHSNYSPTVIFIWHCRQSLINLKLFSSTQLCNVQGRQRQLLLYCSYFCLCVIEDMIFSQTPWLKPHPDKASFPGHILRECSFSPPTEKLQGTAIKVSTSTAYWNSFPALCPPLSMEDAGSWVYLFTAINLVRSCQRHFSVPMQVNQVNLNKACCDNGHSYLYLKIFF